MVRKSMMFSNAKVDVTIYHYASVIRLSLPVRTSGIRGAVQCVTGALTIFYVFCGLALYTLAVTWNLLFFMMRGKKLLILTSSMRLSSNKSQYLIETN